VDNSSTITAEQWHQHTKAGRQKVRFNRAVARIDKIKNGQPALTRGQLQELADRLVDGTGADGEA
jgi:hypothetical protein